MYHDCWSGLPGPSPILPGWALSGRSGIRDGDALFFFFFFFSSPPDGLFYLVIYLSSPQFSLFSIVQLPSLLPIHYLTPRPFFWILSLQSQFSDLILFRLPPINTSLDPVLTPLGNSRETLASGDSGLGLGLIFRIVVHSEGLPSSPLRIFASREFGKRNLES